ncbi:hypothetical protein K402DRAFT_395030, partial [Aulographum hederae CBS 113979]
MFRTGEKIGGTGPWERRSMSESGGELGWMGSGERGSMLVMGCQDCGCGPCSEVLESRVDKCRLCRVSATPPRWCTHL